MNVKIDKSTLPKDGAKVKFLPDDGEWYEGMYDEREEMFTVGLEDSCGKWFYIWQVDEWHYLDGEPLNPIPQESGSILSLKVKSQEHGVIVLENEKGDTYTSKSEGLIDFLSGATLKGSGEDAVEQERLIKIIEDF